MSEITDGEVEAVTEALNDALDHGFRRQRVRAGSSTVDRELARAALEASRRWQLEHARARGNAAAEKSAERKAGLCERVRNAARAAGPIRAVADPDPDPGDCAPERAAKDGWLVARDALAQALYEAVPHGWETPWRLADDNQKRPDLEQAERVMLAIVAEAERRAVARMREEAERCGWGEGR